MKMRCAHGPHPRRGAISNFASARATRLARAPDARVHTPGGRTDTSIEIPYAPPIRRLRSRKAAPDLPARPPLDAARG